MSKAVKLSKSSFAGMKAGHSARASKRQSLVGVQLPRLSERVFEGINIDTISYPYTEVFILEPRSQILHAHKGE